ncbi:cupin domain-containing protein [Shewanella surugensis]|uniref:Cupin domain-containing protein n=1 Tax=Shewanella surugensis TaxID=212020 RepID=A0ABT0LFI7_9GAMM|nr:cupin domain-containing protein [Shewanella surugensis]MCL1126476.1 cupin domain-containing protein [Shewanella surugensis]
MKGITISIVLGLCSSFVHAEVKLGSREVLLDNDTIEVIRLTYPPGSESGMHTHEYEYRAVYFVKGGKLLLLSGKNDDQRHVINIPDGKSLFLPGVTHNVKNIGDTEVIIIETEIK